MDKFISLILSVFITLYSGAVGCSNSLRSAVAQIGIPYGFAGMAVANTVRYIEKKTQTVPSREGFTPEPEKDDTGEEFRQVDNEYDALTWRMNEITLTSEKSYADPFNDVEVNLILAGNGVKYTVPGFWDGGNTWKVRFVCPSEGEWYFRTVCTDSDNSGLDGAGGRVNCEAYDGELEIYRHGFITVSYGNKYLTYADGTPFFYLGDTHWSLGDETCDMVRTITEKRAGQGFTVIQSEPIGAKFDVTDGITEADMAGFRDYDEKFGIIADAGLVHANAQFFYPYSMHPLIERMGGCRDGEPADTVKAYLEKITRYWVARYGAYPVIWTLGQEVDNDFYGSSCPSCTWNPENNPYKLVAKYIQKHDSYAQILTAHQENASMTVAYGNGNGCDEKLKKYSDAEPSAFRNVENHGMYAAQWSPSLTERSDWKIQKDYWYNSQGKPVVNYEGRYCGLWTKNFGSRMQGWASYLSGMFGYGWGAHDTWSYLNVYDEGNDSDDGVDTVTSEEKINATWQDALEYPCSYQVGYMKDFFTSLDWWELIPRFNDIRYFIPDAGVIYYAASNSDNSEMVIYFCSFCDESIAQKPNANAFGGTMTGTVGSLEPSTTYRYRWFNPVTGAFSGENTFVSTPFGTYTIGSRQWNGEISGTDMVLYIYK